MGFRTLFFAMLYINGLLCGVLFDVLGELRDCPAATAAADRKPAGAAPTAKGRE